jgi:hypothetical protein
MFATLKRDRCRCISESPESLVVRNQRKWLYGRVLL